MSIEQGVAVCGFVLSVLTALVLIVMWVNRQLRDTDKAIVESRHKVVQDIGVTITKIDEDHHRERRDLEQRIYRDMEISKSINNLTQEVRRAIPRTTRGSD